MVGLLKKTTGLVGLAVCESPHERLRILYTKIFDVLEQIPKNAAYRKYTEQITNKKLILTCKIFIQILKKNLLNSTAKKQTI
uniref:NADH dehydrogenase [ubiquinone] 1 alpha subcomplex subunit 5 n=2 Tax=Canis lupus familiaris TaxID=9615 RepID=A0A8P0SPK2_CANLF